MHYLYSRVHEYVKPPTAVEQQTSIFPSDSYGKKDTSFYYVKPLMCLSGCKPKISYSTVGAFGSLHKAHNKNIVFFLYELVASIV